MSQSASEYTDLIYTTRRGCFCPEKFLHLTLRLEKENQSGAWGLVPGGSWHQPIGLSGVTSS